MASEELRRIINRRSGPQPTVVVYVCDFHHDRAPTPRAVPRPLHGPLVATTPPAWLVPGVKAVLAVAPDAGAVTVVEVSDLVCLVDGGQNRWGVDTATLAAYWRPVE